MSPAPAMAPPDRVVIVGASVAGMAAAETLRSHGYDRSIVILDAQDELPYDRPPLSKEILTGELDEPDIRLADAGQLADLDIELRPAAPALALDVAGRFVLTHAADVPFDRLLIATGSAAVRPGGWPSLPGVHVLRSIADARALRAALTASSPRVVIIGGGFIGCEVAVAARFYDLDVTIVEAQPMPMHRVLGPALADPIVALHAAHGVRFHCGVGVRRLHGGERVEKVELAGGTMLPAEIVLVSVGAVPVTDWLFGSGLDITDGVATDQRLRTGAAGIYAAGDVARWPAANGGSVRVEHWTNAREQGAQAAVNLLDPSSAEPYDSPPYVWSDQYDSQLQIVGETRRGQLRFTAGSPDAGGYVAVFQENERVIGAVGLDRPREFREARRMVAARSTDIEIGRDTP